MSVVSYLNGNSFINDVSRELDTDPNVKVTLQLIFIS